MTGGDVLSKTLEEKLRKQRVGMVNINKEGKRMTVIAYNCYKDVIVEFDDKFHTTCHTQWHMFEQGITRNPRDKYYGVGLIGNQTNTNTKEVIAWNNILRRCYSEQEKLKNPTYKNVTCCDEWLLYENFEKWLHSQENFEKWCDGKLFAIDKDIILKGNKIYSPDTCCLVPDNVNKLFTKTNAKRGDCPIGVSYHKRDNVFEAHCLNPFLGSKAIYLGRFNNKIDAFLEYKKYKEKIIKQVAENEYSKGNISNKCYKAMMHYEVEITD
jgi:hypothetical protein